jgi:hypothetical protein
MTFWLYHPKSNSTHAANVMCGRISAPAGDAVLIKRLPVRRGVVELRFPCSNSRSCARSLSIVPSLRISSCRCALESTAAGRLRSGKARPQCSRSFSACASSLCRRSKNLWTEPQSWSGDAARTRGNARRRSVTQAPPILRKGGCRGAVVKRNLAATWPGPIFTFI